MNYNRNYKASEILNKSRTLKEYSVFVDRARRALDGTKDEAEKRHALYEDGYDIGKQQGREEVRACISRT